MIDLELEGKEEQKVRKVRKVRKLWFVAFSRFEKFPTTLKCYLPSGRLSWSFILSNPIVSRLT
jgi:hypothetical protein